MGLVSHMLRDLDAGLRAAVRDAEVYKRATTSPSLSHKGEGEEPRGGEGGRERCVCGRGSAPAGEAAPSAVRVTLKSVAATRAQWQQEGGNIGSVCVFWW